jgi:TatD DNase family protein
VRFVDTHCHVDRYPDPNAILDVARRQGVAVVAVTETASSYQTLAVGLGQKEGVRLALGLHPLRAARLGPLESPLFDRLIEGTDYVGEVGLDGSREGKSTLGVQVDVFERILSHSEITSKVLSVHSRGAERQTVSRLADAGVSAILHWYSGPLGVLEEALGAGFYFSINLAMLKSKKGRRIVHEIPRERVLTESDGPYVQVGGRPGGPGDMSQVVSGLSEIWGADREAAGERIFENMASLYQRATTP